MHQRFFGRIIKANLSWSQTQANFAS